MANRVTLEYVGDGDRLISENNKVKNSLNDVDDKTKKTTRGMGDSFKGAAGVIAAAGIGALLHNMFSEAKEGQQVAASTAQGIKTMGAAAWTSADAIGALSESISNKIGVDDELIQSSANLLLTFGNVKNEVGAMNNVFDRAVWAAQDLAAKGFGPADAGAKMLGKALNDPIKGMTALGKAGVTFSEAQKKQITDMVTTGDLLGAQRMLLEEVEKQVGGTAEATATGADKMAVQWGNFQEKLGTEMMPILMAVLGELSKFLAWADEHQTIVIAFAAVAAAIWLVNAAMAANPIVLLIGLVAGLVAAFIILWEKSAGFRDFFIGAWKAIQDSISWVVGWITKLWNGFIALLQRTGILDAIKTIGRIFGAVFGGIGDTIGWIIDRVAGLINWIADAIEWSKKLLGINSGGSFGMQKGGRGVGPKKHHTGGMVGGMVGTEQIITAMAGERVSMKGQGGGGGPITFAGDLNSMFATMFMKAIRDRDIIIPGVNA